MPRLVRELGEVSRCCPKGAAFRSYRLFIQLGADDRLKLVPRVDAAAPIGDLSVAADHDIFWISDKVKEL